MVDGFSCILDFQKFSGGGPPDTPYKRNTSIKPSKSFFNNNKQPKAKIIIIIIKKKKKKKRAGKHPPPFKQYTRNLSLGYTEIEKKEEGAEAISFLCDL